MLFDQGWLLTRRVEEVDLHAVEQEGLAEAVGHMTLLLAEDLGDDEEVVKEEDLALVQPQLLFLVGVVDLVEAAVAHQAAVRQRQLLGDAEKQ